ncbi:hypothetical protein F4779DRAFT_592713 [Xylariaceae sp. FL0662B]|nr:hypothetical protein F4779DRAFT_592713 [Xylariaceae sp. FL0662B]
MSLCEVVNAEHNAVGLSDSPVSSNNMCMDIRTDSQPNMSRLLRLPYELISHTSLYLSLTDLLPLRLTCRQMNAYLYPSFLSEGFSDRRFMITEYSLGRLINISKQPQLAECISSLTIGLDRLNSSEGLPRFRDYWNPETHTVRPHPMVKAGINVRNLEALTVEQNCLISSGQFQLMLYEALSNLPNLDHVILRDALVAKESTRPSSSDLVASYGTAKVKRDTGIDFACQEPYLHENDQFADHVFSNLLLALGRSGTRLKSITVDIKGKDVGLSSSAFALPEFLLSKLQPTLHSLQSLDLSVSFIHVTLGSYSNGSKGFLRWQRHHLFALLERTPNLVCLRIRSKERGFMEDGILGWLAYFIDPAEYLRIHRENNRRPQIPLDELTEVIPPRGLPLYPPLPTASHKFRDLRELELGNMSAPAATLTRILLSFAGSLRRLCLSGVAISVSSTDDELDNNSFHLDAWSSLFRDLHSFLDLEDFAVDTLEHRTTKCMRESKGHQVAFLKSVVGVQSGLESGLLNAWSCRGGIAEMREFLAEVSAKTIIICAICKKKNAGYWSVEDSFRA